MPKITKTQRDPRGRFAPGNAGGPGRPPRATELNYLITLSDAVTPEDWRAIVEHAVTDAKAGDAKAREWLTGYLLNPAALRSLSELAALEALGITPEVMTLAKALDIEQEGNGWGIVVGQSGDGRALSIADAMARDDADGDK